MEIRLVAYDRLGAKRGILPNPLETTFVETDNDLSTLQIHYSQTAPNHEYLENDPEVAVELFNGTSWIEPLNARLRLQSIDFDWLEEVPTKRYDFLGIGEGLKTAFVYQPYGMPLNDEGKVRWSDAGAGIILRTVWDNAYNRGFRGYNLNFSTTLDSAGHNWAKTFTISYGVDTSMAGILSSLVNQGVIDYSWDGRTLNVYNADSIVVDHTLDPGGVRFVGSAGGAGVDSAPEMTNHSGLATHVIVIGENGLRWEFPTNIPLPDGRREIILQYSGVDEEVTAATLAAPVIAKAQNILKNTTRQFHITPATKWLPLVDYNTGDWANVQRGTTIERMKIQAISLTANERGVQGYVTLGDRIDDLLATLYKRIQGMSGGIPNEGAGAPPSATTLPPSAPTGLSGTSNAYINSEGDTRSGVTLVWEHDGKNTEGQSVDVSYYIAEGRKQGDSTWQQLFTSTTKTGAYSPFLTYDEYGVPEVWEFRVKAVSSSNRVSAPSSTRTITLEDDTAPPPTPSAPTLSTWLRTVTVSWDMKGLTPSGVVTNMPADFDYVKVWQGSAPDMADAVVLGITRTDKFYAGSQPANVTKWYALSSVDRTGNESPLSVVASITARNNVDLQEITDVIDGSMLGQNTVTYVALQASEQLWTRVLSAHRIKAGEIDVNDLVADSAWIGSLRAGILVADSVTTDILDADAITSKHTMTGPLYQTVATINRGIKIDVNGFRSYDNNGALLVNINSTSATFTGTVKSGFGTNWAAIMDNAGRGRPGLQLGSNNSDFWQPQVLGTAGLDGYAAGALMAVSGRQDGGSYWSQLILQKGGDWRVGDYNGSSTVTAIYSMAPNIVKIQGGAAVIQAGGTVAYMQAGNGTVQVDNGGTTVWGAFSVSGSKNFIMDHPTKLGWDLRHGSTESPVSGVEYWKCGIMPDTGEALIQLPDYFEALVKPGSVCIGAWGNGAEVSWDTEVVNNQFKIYGTAGTNFTWLVKAERIGGDFEVESLKPLPDVPLGPSPEEPTR